MGSFERKGKDNIDVSASNSVTFCLARVFKQPHDRPDIAEKEMEANSNLIASSSELLEVLKELIYTLSDRPILADKELTAIYYKGNKIINKAEGN